MIWKVSGGTLIIVSIFVGGNILKKFSTALLVSLSFIILSCGDFNASNELPDNGETVSDTDEHAGNETGDIDAGESIDEIDSENTEKEDTDKNNSESQDEDIPSTITCSDNPCSQFNKTVCTDSGDSYTCSCVEGTEPAGEECRMRGDSIENPYIVEFKDNSVVYEGDLSNDLLINDYSGSCGDSSGKSRDTVYSFTLIDEKEVSITTAGKFDPVIYILDKDGKEVACAKADESAVIKTALKAGKYHLIIDGNDSTEGEYSLTITVKSGEDQNKPYTQYENLRDDALAQALYNEIKGGKPLGYNKGARDVMFSELDNIDGKVECYYSGRTISNPSGSKDAYNKGFNTEHSWPQSQFGKSEPMRSDLHHLFPTVVGVNGARSSYDFGNVSSSGKTFCGPSGSGCSKLGTGTTGGRVFEVRPERRGDIARAHFYMAIRYYNRIDDNGSHGDGSIKDKEEAVLRKWHKEDPVDEREMRRNNLIEKHQGKGNRNPFIDRPDFVDFISDF